MSYLRNLIVSCFLLLLISVLAIDALPKWTEPHQAIHSKLLPALIWLGIAQENWRLFAPHIDIVNRLITAELEYPDGTKVNWRQANWGELSSLERFLSIRDINYYDYISKDYSKPAWKPLADYLRREVGVSSSDGQLAQRVVLKVHREILPAPLPQRWQPPRTSASYGEGEVFFIMEYP